MTDLDLRAMSVRCPLCNSRPHVPCRNPHGGNNNPHGGNNPVPHAARVDRYVRIFTKMEDK